MMMMMMMIAIIIIRLWYDLIAKLIGQLEIDPNADLAQVRSLIDELIEVFLCFIFFFKLLHADVCCFYTVNWIIQRLRSNFVKFEITTNC